MLIYALKPYKPAPRGWLGRWWQRLKDRLLPERGVYYAVFSYYAISRLKQETGKDLADVGDDPAANEAFVYHALVAGCRHEGVEPPAREEVPLIIDANYAELQAAMVQSFRVLEEEKKKAEKSSRLMVRMA